MEGPALKGIGVLQHLQELVLIKNPLSTASHLSPLPPSLTSLTIEGDPNGYSGDCRADLSAALSLQMHLAGPGNPTGSSTTPANSLLSLQIPGMSLNEPSVLSTLTSLTSLDARGLRSNKPHQLSVVVPCLRKLRHLDIGITKTSEYSGIFGGSSHSSRDNPCLVTADLERLVSGCPNLESLGIAAMPRPAAPRLEGSEETGCTLLVSQQEPCSLLPLQDVKRLTRLSLWANDLMQDSHLEELATLTRLQSLDICATGHLITDTGVQQLTQLTALTRLWIDAKHAYEVSNEVASTDSGYNR
jgi:hypothetical protein